MADTCKTLNYVLGIALIVFVIVIIILSVTGVLHWGKIPAPTPTPGAKATCAEYAINMCAGSRTTSGRVCEVKENKCQEYTPPGPTPPSPLDPVSISAWFIANPHKQVTIRPTGSAIEYQVSYEGIAAPPAQEAPSLAVTVNQYDKDLKTLRIVTRSVYGVTSAGSIRTVTTLVKGLPPTTSLQPLTVLDSTGSDTIRATLIHPTGEGVGYKAIVADGGGVQQLNPNNSPIATLPPMPIPP